MITTNIHNAKTHLSQLIAKALEGEEVIIAKAGKQLVRLLPIETSTPRASGLWKGKVSIAPDFDTLPAEMQSTLTARNSIAAASGHTCFVMVAHRSPSAF